MSTDYNRLLGAGFKAGIKSNINIKKTQNKSRVHSSVFTEHPALDEKKKHVRRD